MLTGYCETKSKDLKNYWSFLWNATRENSIIWIGISTMHAHFRYLNVVWKYSAEWKSFKMSIDVIDWMNKPFTEEEVKKCFWKIEPGKLTGLNNIYPEIIKHSAKSKRFDEILDKGLDTVVMSEYWTISIPTHFSKKCDRSNLNNYRHSSLPRSINNFFMSELSDRKQEDFGNSNFLGKQQASIRKYISCMCQAIVSSSLISWYLRQKTSFFCNFFWLW